LDISQISAAIRHDAMWVVFLNVLMQQAGLPVPAVPTMLVAGSLALSGGQAGAMLGVAVLASVIADCVWYGAGRAFGYRVLSGLCRLSINPGSCVSQTETRFRRWGVWTLVFAKFVPGFSTVAPPIAGSLKLPLASFIAAAAAGAGLWAGAAILTGWLLRYKVQSVIAVVSGHGTGLALVAALLLAVWLAWKFWQKYRFAHLAAIPHISVAELAEALAAGEAPLLLDLRSADMIARTGPVPGAIAVQEDQLPTMAGAWPRDRRIVTMCACPADASAIKVAHLLSDLGYTSVFPLKGGYDAWMAHAGRNQAAR